MKPVSIEILVFFVLFMGLFKLQLISTDVSNPITEIVLVISIAELVRILYKLRKLRKEGLNVDEQQFRSPIYDSISPQAGDVYAKYSKWRVYLIGVSVVAVLMLYFFFHVNIFDH